MSYFRDRLPTAAELLLANEMGQGGTRVGSPQGWSGCCWHCVSLSLWAEVLLDTTGETSEIGWLTYPPGGVSALFILRATRPPRPPPWPHHWDSGRESWVLRQARTPSPQRSRSSGSPLLSLPVQNLSLSRADRSPSLSPTSLHKPERLPFSWPSVGRGERVG